MARVELAGIAKDFDGVTAVAPTDLVVEDGEFVAVLGPSGCGKSTTLFMLAGILKPSSGEIRFDGARINDVEARDRNVGIVFQSYALYPHMTALANIMFPLRFLKVGGDAAKARALAMAKLVRVDDLLERRPGQMSGGQQQRIALARALVKEPGLLLLDEPLSNLDAGLRLAMRTEIRRLQRRLGVTTLLVTHDQHEAVAMADRIVCMSKGRIEQVDTAAGLYETPASLFVASFLGQPPINLIEAAPSNGGLALGHWRMPMPADLAGPVIVGIRPEAITLGRGPIDGRVEEIEPHGRETIFHLSTPLGGLRALEAGAIARFVVGEQVPFSIDRCFLFDAASGRRIAAQAGWFAVPEIAA